MDPRKLTEQNEAIKAIGLGKPLVKRWRTQKTVDVQKPRWRRDKVKIGIYLDPRKLVFYTRVPETDDGTLYASRDADKLRVDVAEAVSQWMAEEARGDLSGREWETRIRIFYSASTGRGRVASLLRNSTYPMNETEPAVGVPPCPELGAMTFSRYERSLDPSGAVYTVRELEADYLARVEVWHGLDPERRRDSGQTRKPVRRYDTESLSKTKPTSKFERARYNERSFRDLPYSEEVWDQLCGFVDRFHALDSTLSGFLIRSDESAFREALALGGNLLTDRSDG